MARVNTLTNFLTDVADAIRTKTGGSAQIPAANFDTEILSITTGGGNILREGMICKQMSFDTTQLHVFATNVADKMANLDISNIYTYEAFCVLPDYNTASGIYSVDGGLGYDSPGLPRVAGFNICDLQTPTLLLTRKPQTTINTEPETYYYLDPTYTLAYITLDEAMGTGMVNNWLTRYDMTLDQLKALSGWYKDVNDTLVSVQSVTLDHFIMYQIFGISLEDWLSDGDSFNSIDLDSIDDGVIITYYNPNSEEEPAYDEYTWLMKVANGRYMENVLEDVGTVADASKVVSGYHAFGADGYITGTAELGVMTQAEYNNALDISEDVLGI